MRFFAASFVSLALSACASKGVATVERCFVQEEAVAREIAALVSGMRADDGSLQVEDQGDHWQVGSYVQAWLEGDMIVTQYGGFTFTIDKCTGAMSGYRAWR